jgi:hypothetical protein
MADLKADILAALREHRGEKFSLWVIQTDVTRIRNMRLRAMNPPPHNLSDELRKPGPSLETIRKIVHELKAEHPHLESMRLAPSDETRRLPSPRPQLRLAISR